MRVAVIGCGVMGRALARHFAKAHLVVLSDHTPSKSQKLADEIGGEAVATSKEAVEKAEVIILAIKPKDLHAFARETTKAFHKEQLVVSILAGTSLDVLRECFPAPAIIRAMPNLGLTCGKGVIGFVKTEEITPKRQAEVNELFQGLGLLPWLSESKLEALSALAGSGPAFILLLIEALTDGGVYLGLTGAEAFEFVLQTIEGAVALLKSTGKSPAELKANIASPGGTTIAGLKVLEESGVRGILMNTLIATYQKAQK